MPYCFLFLVVPVYVKCNIADTTQFRRYWTSKMNNIIHKWFLVHQVFLVEGVIFVISQVLIFTVCHQFGNFTKFSTSYIFLLKYEMVYIQVKSQCTQVHSNKCICSNQHDVFAGNKPEEGCYVVTCHET